MKNKIFTKIFLLAALFASQNILAQDLTGVWKGTLYNDSTQKYLPYEIVISDDNGKLNGYSRTVFDINGKPEVGVKKIKIKKKNDEVIIESGELVFNDYTEAAPKGIHQNSVVEISTQDTLMFMKGKWATNRTKKYLPATGTLELQKKIEYKSVPLYKKLEELHLTDNLSFNKKLIEKEKPMDVSTKEISTAVAVSESPITPTATTTIKKSKKIKTKNSTPKNIDTIIIKTTIQTNTVAIPVAAAADVAKRKIVNTQDVFFTSDSLTLTLYDNGEVDGDIVSVLLNGKMIFENTLLTTQPNSKTIYIDKHSPDSLQLVMYAENLGSIPPNTGLLVVNDGDAVYDVRFTADLQTNAAIILRRKKK